MPDGDILKATIEGTFASSPVVMDLGFISSAGAADFKGDADGLNAELEAALGFDTVPNPFMEPLSVQYKVTGIRIQDASPGVSAGVLYELNQAGGNETDDALPPNDALCVTWRTGIKGQANRGRTYLTGFAEDSQNAGYWIPEIQTWASFRFVSALMNSFGPAGTGNYFLAVIHTVSGGTRLVPPTATPITSGDVNNTVRSLRRRAIGVRISRKPSGA